MNVTLNPELQERLDQKIRRGEFASADAIVEQALTFFLDYEESQMSQEDFRDAKKAISVSLDQAGPGEGLPLEEFDRYMRAKHGIQR